MSEPTREETLCRMGDAAELLLGNEAFNSTINSLVDQTFQTFANTKPDDSVGRDSSYHLYRALVDVVSTLQQRVSVRDEIMSKAGDNNQEEE